MFITQRNVYFSTCSPDNHYTVTIVSSFKVAYVLTDLFSHFPAGSSLFNMSSVKTFHPVLVESSFHRFDSLQFFFHAIQIFLHQNLSMLSSCIHIIFKDIPSTKYQIIKICQWNYIFNFRKTIFIPFAQTDGCKLSDRSDRFCKSFANCQGTYNCSGRYSTT